MSFDFALSRISLTSPSRFSICASHASTVVPARRSLAANALEPLSHQSLVSTPLVCGRGRESPSSNSCHKGRPPMSGSPSSSSGLSS
jgi:hypothetical protein